MKDAVSAPKVPISGDPPHLLQPLIPAAEMREGAEVARTRVRTRRARLWSSRFPSAGRLLISAAAPSFTPALHGRPNRAVGS